MPLVQGFAQGKDINFAFSRPSFGWSIGWDMNFLGLTRFDITPKIGLSDFRSELPIQTASGVVVSTFEVKNAMSFGAEVGVEAITPWMLLRFWGASDLSTALGINGTKSVSSLRGGVDAYIQVHTFASKYSLSLVAFGNAEELGFEDNIKPKDATEAATKVRSVNLSLAFVGTGLSLSW